jgi:hypothetical protein
VGDYRSYSDKLKDPKWQQKRLRVFEKAGFRCGRCHVETKMLHVHHAYYEKGVKPWEYPDESLHCLCVDCHEHVQQISSLLQREIGTIGLAGAEQLLGYAMGVKSQIAPMAKLQVFSPHVLQGIADAWALPTESVQRTIHDSITDGFALHALAKQQTQHASKAPTKQIEGTCPQCRGSRVVRILWGYPTPTADVRRQISEGCLLLAGEFQYTQGPAWACLDCEPGWQEIHDLVIDEQQFNARKKDAVAKQDFENASKLRDEANRAKDKRFEVIREVLAPPEEPRTDWAAMRRV